MMDNSAIGRIAAPDLAPDVLAMLERHGANDDVIFFLGRFVWQGNIAAAVPRMLAIACDPKRGRYARIAATRAVMTAGDDAQREALWSTIAAHPDPLDRTLLAEILRNAAPTQRSVALLLESIERLPAHERFEVTGLEDALHEFIDRLPIMLDDFPDQPLARLVDGLDEFLGRTPHIERGECHVSSDFAWAMGPALHAVERLVAKKAKAALGSAAIGILLKMPALRFFDHHVGTDHKSRLGELVPRWPALNDALYWTNVAERRAYEAAKGGQLTDDRFISFMDHFWGFGPADFPRCLAWVSDRTDLDDRLVALSRATSIYLEAGSPAEWRDRLEALTRSEAALASALAERLTTRPSPKVAEWEAERLRWKRQDDRRNRKQQRDRAAWIGALRADPDRVRHPAGLEPGQFSNDQYHLLLSAREDSVVNRHEETADWRSLIPEFGVDVAEAFRDAALAHWRAYSPALKSEGGDTSTIPYSVIFALVGLTIEAGEDGKFGNGLTPDEARHAFRYTTWEMNGFPSWLEALYRAHKDIGLAAILAELHWELDNSSPDGSMHYILHDLVYHAPWLHAEVAPHILAWLTGHDMPNPFGLGYCLAILRGGDVAPEALADLASAKLGRKPAIEQRAAWYALWVDCAPEAAIGALEAELASMEPTEASTLAQHFSVGLLGDSRGGGIGQRFGGFRQPVHLKTLYVLMHTYIRVADDIERAGKGAFTPTLRDDAQNSRNRLFGLLADVPGAESYAALRALAEEHPEPGYRSWMLRKARERAIADADEPAWSAAQLFTFARGYSSASPLVEPSR